MQDPFKISSTITSIIMVPDCFNEDMANDYKYFHEGT